MPRSKGSEKPSGEPVGGDVSLHKRLESARISADIARFEGAGGHIERLGTTQVLKKVGLPEPRDGSAASGPRRRGRPPAKG
ncbi:hypothetical protein H4F99_01140 [Lysobacter sp. SG-8]|uniref:Uncharacterized protein n=1 Tax=Marilutibacter penaei TaxID=2759900 RepID=A0A7W3U1A8_9GAMM|nr:hypothetical protein [Lysobacter penaei]MBB1087087.1 hypothetical protein [Lysobacter penaei]